ALNVLEGRLADCTTIFMTYGSKRTKLLVHEALNPPSPSCPACSSHRAVLQTNIEQTTLRDLVLWSQLPSDRASTPDTQALTVLDGKRLLLDPDLAANLGRKLSDIGIRDSSFVTVDYDGKRPLTVVVTEHTGLARSRHRIAFDLSLLPFGLPQGSADQST